jgi:glycosyltransferase involved in cell wall biosynthesis
LITVVIPNKGRTELLRMAIESLTSQSLSAWEALIVDDGSTDEELEVIRQSIGEDPRLRLVVRDAPPAGANHCRNIGIQRARSDLLVFLDSDDALSTDCLRRRVEAMAQKPDLAFIVFPHEHFRDRPGDMNDPWPMRNDEDHLKRFLIMYPPWQTAGPTWRRSALDAVGPWDESLPCGQDWDYHVRALALQLPYVVVDGPRFFHRITGEHRESISTWKQRTLAGVTAYQRIFTKAFDQLRSGGLMTRKRELLFARLYLVTAEELLRFDERQAALRWWERALELGLITRRQHQEGRILLRVHGIPILRRVLRLYTRASWPPQLRYDVTLDS